MGIESVLKSTPYEINHKPPSGITSSNHSLHFYHTYPCSTLENTFLRSHFLSPSLQTTLPLLLFTFCPPAATLTPLYSSTCTMNLVNEAY